MANELVITPTGRICIQPTDGTEDESSLHISQTLQNAFAQSSSRGLSELVISEVPVSWPPAFNYWRDFALQYLTQVCQSPDLDRAAIGSISPPPDSDLDQLLEQAPPMPGLEYLNREVMRSLWKALDELVRQEIQEHNGTAREYVKSKHPVLHLLGRVTFHLAENKRDPECPFAFMATYTHRLSRDAKIQHLPLAKALNEYSGNRNRGALLSLLEPVKRASETSEVARELAESGDLFHPLAWTPRETHKFLRDIPIFEQSGIVVRVPDWWKKKGPARPMVRVAVGNQPSRNLGLDAMLDFSVQVSLNGENLTPEEINAILKSTHGLVLLKGQWVEVDRDQLSQVLDHWRHLERMRSDGGLSFIEGMRLLSGAHLGKTTPEADPSALREWSTVAAGEWLQQVLEEIRQPRLIDGFQLPPDLKADLRSYQRDGVKWLWFMCRLGLGACLADDMGLGKTIQVLALLLHRRRNPTTENVFPASLLVIPASLIGNWQAEIRKFAPSLRVFIAHPSEIAAHHLAAISRKPDRIQGKFDLVITTYSLVHRYEWLNHVKWSLIILDEAQAIKNPSTRQTRALKKLGAQVRIALTGTPVENRLGDLWSLFDFICPGLLGSAQVFTQFTKRLTASEHPDFSPLRALVKPYILRRLKTDKTIIQDLPDKTEIKTFCALTKKQAVLYQQAVDELARALATADRRQRRGIILAFILRFKQICNHPAQWLQEEDYVPSLSGKFDRLTELCEQIAAKQEKVLVFTQFRQITEPLSRFLATLFRREGLVLHGAIPVGKRPALVEAFERESGPPYFILSVKAGGTGLNLTAASHVIHFDRWWNPAVENQATDRAYRIGQRRNVLVHKLVCRGTIEERIDQLIDEKKNLARDVLEGGGETMLTEMDNDQLLKFVSLDIKSAVQE